jgi:hypothetical protein
MGKPDRLCETVLVNLVLVALSLSLSNICEACKCLKNIYLCVAQSELDHNNPIIFLYPIHQDVNPPL